MAQYINAKELFSEVVKSKELGQLTPRAVEMFQIMVREISRIFKYKLNEDREDCMAFAMEDILKYWNRFDPAKSNNAFAFFTQVTKNAFAKGWRRLYPIKASMKVSISKEHGVYNFAMIPPLLIFLAYLGSLC